MGVTSLGRQERGFPWIVSRFPLIVPQYSFTIKLKVLWDIIEIILSFQVHGCVMIKLTTLTFSKALEMNTMVQKPIIKTMLDIWAMSPLSGSVFPASSYYSSCINWLLSVTWTKKSNLLQRKLQNWWQNLLSVNCDSARFFLSNDR